MSNSRLQLQDWLRTIEIEDKTVLDIGAGPKDKWASNYVFGKPKSYKTADVSKEIKHDYYIDLNMNLPKELIGKKFDYVFCLETLEHTWNPIECMKNLAKLTREKLFISTPFVNPIHDVVDYFRYTFQWYEFILPELGFVDVEITQRIAPDNAMREFYDSQYMRMSKVTLRAGYGNHYNDVGYCVEATKLVKEKKVKKKKKLTI